jgi:SSS family transporter
MAWNSLQISIIVVLIVLFSALVAVGLYFRKRTSNVAGFVLGGRDVGPWITAFSYGVTYFSAVIFVGFAGQFGWRFGISAVWIGIGNAFIGSLMAWFLLGKRTRIMTNHLNSATMPEFFGKRYLSGNLKIAASIIIFIFMIPYTASLFNGLSWLFSEVFDIPFEAFIIVMGLVTAIFVVAGGYFAAAVNDFIQGIIMLICFCAIIFAVMSDNGGFTEAIHSLARINVDEATHVPGVFASFFGPDPLTLLGVVILTSLGAWGLPQMVARFYAIKSETMIPKGAIVSTVFALVVAGGSYFLGGFGRLYSDVVVRNEAGGVVFDRIMPTILTNISDVMTAVVIILVFAASISTLSALVMSSSSTLTLDFIKGNIVREMSNKKQLTYLRVLIVFFIMISATIAITSYRGNIIFIAQLMGISWGAMAGSFLAPFLYGLFWKRASTISIWCCFIFSSGLMTLNIFFRSSFPSILQSPINCGAFCILAGLIIVPLVSLVSKAPDKKSVDDCFSVFQK